MNKLTENVVSIRSFIVLLLVSFLTIWGYGAQRVMVPLQMNEYGTDILKMGLILSLFGLPRAIMNIVGGYLSYRFSKRNNIIVSVILFGIISPYFIGISDSDIGLGIWRVGLAIGVSWATTSMVSYLADLTKEKIRGTALGIQKMVTWSGMALAGLLAPILLKEISFQSVMIFSALLSILALLLVFLFLRDVNYNLLRSEKKETDDLPLDQPQAFFFQKVILSWNGCFTKMIEDGFITFFIPVFIVTHTHNLVAVGVIISIFTAIYVISQPLGGILSDLIGSWKVMILGLLLIIIGFMTLLFSNSLSFLYFSAIILGGGSGMITTSGEMKASLLGTPDQSSRNLGYFRFYRDLGSTIGPILVGVSLANWSENILLSGMMILSILSLLLSIFVLIKNKSSILHSQGARTTSNL